jgi:hypothetical protein
MKNFKLFCESLEDTSWTKNNNTITLVEILDITKDIKVQEIDVKTLKEYVLDWDGNPKEIEKIEKSDLKYPILVLINDDESIKYILDGNHRVQKAIKGCLCTIKGKLITFSELPSYVKKVLG